MVKRKIKNVKNKNILHEAVYSDVSCLDKYSSVFIGIDVGKTGGIAVLNNTGCPVVLRALPTVAWRTASGKTKWRIKSAELSAVLKNVYQPTRNIYCGLELVHVLPTDGRVSAFSFGHAYGSVQAVLEVISIPYVEITAVKWLNYFGLRGGDKQERVKFAVKYMSSRFQELMLNIDDLLKHDGIIDAYLIAVYVFENCKSLFKVK